MAAYTTLPDGRVERYHYPHLSVCHDPDCGHRHATADELYPDEAPYPIDDDEDRARDFDNGVSAGKGEL